MANSVFNFDNGRFESSQEVKQALDDFFGNTVRSFGVRGGKCLKWVRITLQSVLGWTYNRNINTFSTKSAWNLFANIIDNELTYYDYTKIGKEKNFTNVDLKDAGTKNGSLVFGFYETSSYKKTSIAVLDTIATDEKKSKLQSLRTRYAKNNRYKYNPITHIGIYYNDQFFHVINSKGVTRQPTSSFYPVAYWDCIDRYVKAFDLFKSFSDVSDRLSELFGENNT